MGSVSPQSKADCRDEAYQLAQLAGKIIAVEIAYDITDTLKTSPDQYPEQLYQLARLAARIVREIDRLLSPQQKKISDDNRALLKKTREELLGFREKLEKLLTCLDRLGDEERRRIVVEFAALAVAPDQDAYKLAEVLHGKASQSTRPRENKEGEEVTGGEREQ